MIDAITVILFGILHQPFHGWNIVSHLRQTRIMMKVDVSRLSIAMLGHDHYSQSFSGIFAFTVYRLGRRWRDGTATSPCPRPVRWLHSHAGRSIPGDVRAGRTFTVQLAQKQYGDIQLLSQQFGFAACLCHLLFSVPVTLIGLHIAELQVIQNHHIAVSLAFQHSGRRTHPVHACHPDGRLCGWAGGQVRRWHCCIWRNSSGVNCPLFRCAD